MFMQVAAGRCSSMFVVVVVFGSMFPELFANSVFQEIQLSDVGSLLGRIMQGSYTSIFNTHKKKYENGSATFDVRFHPDIFQSFIRK